MSTNKNFLVKLAFGIHNSKKYITTKKFFYNILENNKYKYKRYIDIFLVSLIIMTMVELVYSIRHVVPTWLYILDFYIVTALFALEYLLRMWVYSDIHTIIIKEFEKAQFLKKPFSIPSVLKKVIQNKFSYAKTPSAIVDMVAIMPIHRELRILRIFKLLRYTKSISQFTNVLKTKKFELITLLFLLIFLIGSAGIAMYAIEGNINKNINSLFDAVYWALVTVTTVGYGDISPVTTLGKILAMIVIVTGLILIAFSTSVIVSAFLEKLGEIKDNRIIETINKEQSFVIICGYGQMTKMLLRQNDFDGKYVIIEKNSDVAAQITKDGFNAITNDASRHEVIQKFNIKYAKISILCLSNNDVENIYITLNAKSLSTDINVIARASNESMKKKFKLAGANHVIIPNQMANIMLLSSISHPITYNVIHALLSGERDAYLDEIIVLGHDMLVGKTINEIDFKNKKLILLGMINSHNSEFIFNPPSSTRLMQDDILLIMGLKISIEYFIDRYQRGAK